MFRPRLILAVSSDRFHAELGSPEDQSAEGMAYTFTHKAVRIVAVAGLRDLGLDQLGGLLLALDWVANGTHGIWAGAVMVGPGVAVTARHVVVEMRAKGFLAAAGGQLFAVSFDASGRVAISDLSSSKTTQSAAGCRLTRNFSALHFALMRSFIE